MELGYLCVLGSVEERKLNRASHLINLATFKKGLNSSNQSSRSISVSPNPFSPFFDSLFFTIPGLLFHHLPHSHRGKQGSVLSLKLLSSYLTLFGILFATSIALSSNFMTPIYDFKFYDSNLYLQYPSLRPFPSGPHLYFSLPIGHHKLDGNRHLKINKSNSKSSLSPFFLSKNLLFPCFS